ncbi:DUF2059 domain-containing protein [Flavihumibacter profundi]|uniref:DUF2059 domain-containing protein n=1 Tax=Flavihumibacter profundi TaxID=2716883 RepID=UPI001CC4B286|nr:DUF2059 domain-containing protein [Flavihumibacter profundi]MBZ5855502.1 DUF2059 domain-containing protein [Flavihumibacter profundi]
MKKVVIITTALLLSATCFCQSNKKDENIRELLNLTGASKVGIQLMGNMFDAYKKQLPNVPAEFWDEVMKEVKAEEITELVIPIYAKYYTEQEILSLIEFYKSPLGKKVIEYMPLISQDSFSVGQDWGKKLSERVISRLKQKGYIQNG